MAIRQVKDYYNNISKMYFELVDDLKEMQQDFQNGEVTEEELNKLLAPVSGIKENYQRLSYLLYLLYQPQRKKKAAQFDERNKNALDYFKELKITQEQELKADREALNRFKEEIKRFKESKTNDNR